MVKYIYVDDFFFFFICSRMAVSAKMTLKREKTAGEITVWQCWNCSGVRAVIYVSRNFYLFYLRQNASETIFAFGHALMYGWLALVVHFRLISVRQCAPAANIFLRFFFSSFFLLRCFTTSSVFNYAFDVMKGATTVTNSNFPRFTLLCHH